MTIITAYGDVVGFPGCLVLKDLPAMQEMQVWYLGLEDPLEKEIILSILVGHSMDRGTWRATVQGTVKELKMT